MRVSSIQIKNFRGVRSGFIKLGKHPVFVGDNNTGKTTLIEALALLLGRDRLVRELTEHDFYGSRLAPVDRIKLVATLTDFPNDDPEQSSHWFRDGRAVVKWVDEATGDVHQHDAQPRELAGDQGIVEFDAAADGHLEAFGHDIDLPRAAASAARRCPQKCSTRHCQQCA